MPVSTECAAALLSFRYPSLTLYSKQWWHDLQLCEHVHRVCDPCHGC